MKFLSHVELVKWLESTAKREKVTAPVDVEGVVLYRPVDDVSEIDWDHTRPAMSIKEFFFPPTETLLTIEKKGDSVNLIENMPSEKSVIFGVRSCDARGMLALDAMFIDKDPVDVHYAARRENTTLVGVACVVMEESCFCTSMGGGPSDPGGLDVLLHPVEGGYLVDVITDKGTAVLEEMNVREAKKKKKLGPAGRQVVFEVPGNWPELFKAALWDHVSERCLSCRICAYVCPTCRCFDVRDEKLPTTNGGSRSQRIRNWDSCAGEVYRQIAGGHNPREAKRDRTRNRYMCKFYYYPEQYDSIACTGCGRCIDACPVNIDITEILGELAEMSV